MLQQVTWGQFFYLSSIILAAYYIAIGLLYYRMEITAIVKRKVKVKAFTKPIPAPAVVGYSQATYEDSSDDEPEYSAGDLEDKERQLFNDADCLNDDLADLFYACKCEEWTRDELLPLIRKKLKQYRHFATSSFAPSFNSYIVDKAKEDCDMTLGYEEVQALWQ